MTVDLKKRHKEIKSVIIAKNLVILGMTATNPTKK